MEEEKETIFLMNRLEALKQELKILKSDIEDTEEKLFDSCGDSLPEEGTRTFERGGRTLWVRTKLNRKVEQGKVQKVIDEVGVERSPFRQHIEWKLDLKKLRVIQEMDREAYLESCRAFCETPAKVQFSVVGLLA